MDKKDLNFMLASCDLVELECNSYKPDIKFIREELEVIRNIIKKDYYTNN